MIQSPSHAQEAHDDPKRLQLAWMLFDWAAQPIWTLIVTFIYTPYLVSKVFKDPVLGQQLIGLTNTMIGVVVALLAPSLGAIADLSPKKKNWMLLFSLMIVLGSGSLWFGAPNMPQKDWVWVLLGYAVAIIGAELATTFTNAMLPSLTSPKNIAKLSGFGWGLGYLGGLVSLLITLAFLAEGSHGKTLLQITPIFGLDASQFEGTRATGPLAAVWYAVFVCPLLLMTKNTHHQQTLAGRALVSTAFLNLFRDLKGIMRVPALGYFLLASTLYRDALGGIFIFGGIYATGVLDWSVVQVGIFGIIAAFSASIGNYVGAYVDYYFGPKTTIRSMIFLLILVNFMAIGISRTHVFGWILAPGSALPDHLFYLLGALLGFASGPLQASSRTYVVYLCKPQALTQWFGLFAMIGRATAFLAPFLVTQATYWFGSQQIGIAPLVGLFMLGGFFLRYVPDYRLPQYPA